MSLEAFDLAEQFQTPVFVLSDLDLGMNNWMSEPFIYPDKPMQRGKVLTAEDLRASAASNATRTWTATASPYRTCRARIIRRQLLHPRQRPQRTALCTPSDPTTTRLMERLARKFETARTMVPTPVTVATGTSKIGLDRVRDDRFRGRGEPRSAQRRIRSSRPITCVCGPIPFTRGVHDVCRRARSRLRDRAEPRCADAELAQTRLCPAEDAPSCAASGTTTACPSTRVA